MAGLLDALSFASKVPKLVKAAEKISDPARTQVFPMPNRWFLEPDKFPNVQGLVERVLATNKMERSDFFSGAFVDPKTAKVLDFGVMNDVGVAIDPKTNRPKMSGMPSGLESFNAIPKESGPATHSNLVRKGLFKRSGGDPILDDLNFLATIERSGAGHQYGLSTEYATPTELLNTMTGQNPTLRPHSRGDLFGVGDVVGQIVTPQGLPKEVYESLLVAPKGSDVQGVKLHKKNGGVINQTIEEAKRNQSGQYNDNVQRVRKISQYEKDFNQYMASQQEARQQLAKDIGVSGVSGGLGYLGQNLLFIPDIASLVLPDSITENKFYPSTDNAIKAIGSAVKHVPGLDSYADPIERGLLYGTIAGIPQAMSKLPAQIKAIPKFLAGSANKAKSLVNNALAPRELNEEARHLQQLAMESFAFKDGGAVHMKDGTDEAIRQILEQTKNPSTATYDRLPTQTVSQFEQEFRDRLARDQTARQNAVKRGVSSWIPEIPGMLADLAVDVPYNIAQRASGRRGENIKPLGFGEDVRRGVSQALGMAPASLGETGMSMPPDKTNEAVTTGLQLANPLMWGSAGNPAAIARVAGKGAKALGPTAANLMEDYMMKAGLMPSVVKPKGGNWLNDNVEGALRNLKTEARLGYAADDKKMFEAELADLMEQEARTPGRHAARIPVVKGLIAELDKKIPLDNWIDKQLTRYVKNEMGTPEDPIRALAEKGDIHFTPEGGAVGADLARKKMGMPADPISTSPLAQAWENRSDSAIGGAPYRNNFKFIKEYPTESLRKMGGEFAVNNPDAFAHRVDRSITVFDLGFGHIIDELRNATNPASGLPRELLLKPESLSKLSVPQAVERVAKINEWRAAQMETARKAAREGIPVHKEFPDGYKWMASPDTVADAKALQYIQDVGCEGGWCTQGENLAKQYGGEGNQLYVLHDPSGKAVTQISVQKNENPYPVSGEAFARLTGAEKAEYGEHVRQWRRRNPDVEELTDEHVTQALKEAGVQPQPDRIVEIKGKQNRAPSEEYLPYVQDFVRSGKWSDVGDLRNTGLFKADPNELGMNIPEDPRLKNLPGRRTDDLIRAQKAGLFGDKQYVTRKEWEDILRQQIESESGPLPPIEGMKRGGPVSQDAMQMAVWNKAVRKAGGGEVTQAEIDAATQPYRMPVPKRPKLSIDTSGAKAAGTVLSAMAAGIPAGYAGMLELARTGFDPKMAADAAEALQERYMSIPDDQRTAEKVGGIANLLKPLSVPAEYIGEKVLGLTGSPLSATAAEVFLDPLNYLPAIGKAPAAAKAVGRVASEIANAELTGRSGLSGQRGAITWHGSPHRFPPTAKNPLGEFDPMKIGTGEGAQAYGHGLYLAESPGVASEYRSRLAGQPEIQNLRIGSKNVGPKNNFDYSPKGNSTIENIHSSIIEDLLINQSDLLGMYSAGGDKALHKMVMENLDKRINDYATEWPEGVAHAQQLKAQLSSPSSVSMRLGEQPGAFYKVDLPDEQITKMLDWDKPLSQQSAIADSIKGAGGKVYSASWYLPTPKGGKYPIKVSLMNGDSPMTGRQFYQRVSQELGGDGAASQYFKDLKIPGIRYLDGGSRGAGQGTSNFVVFDPKHMNIVGREKEGGLVNQDAMQMAVWDKAVRKAGGGKMSAAEALLKGAKAVSGLGKTAESMGSAEKVGAGLLVPPIVKPDSILASKALDTYIGEKLGLTPSVADRMVARPGRSREKGGPMFSWLSTVDPDYAGYVWANKGKSKSTQMIGMAKDNPGLIFTPQFGDPEMHRSNQVTFERLLRAFNRAKEEGKLTPELEDAYNKRLTSFYKDVESGKPLFSPEFSIRDIKAKDVEKMPFPARAAIAEVWGGKGLREYGYKRQEAAQIIPYKRILENMTEPSLIDAPSGSVGPRLFTLSGERFTDPSIHAAYPEIVGGKDLGVQYGVAPRDVIAHEFVKKIEASKGRPPGHMDWDRNSVVMPIDREMIQRLQDAGFKKGGKVVKKAEGGLTSDDLILEERKF